MKILMNIYCRMTLQVTIDENGKIKYKIWRIISNEQRDAVINAILDGEYNIDILSLISPDLYFSMLPINYSGIQLKWSIANTSQSQDVIDAIHTLLSIYT
jgi:hypothetical protein